LLWSLPRQVLLRRCWLQNMLLRTMTCNKCGNRNKGGWFYLKIVFHVKFKIIGNSWNQIWMFCRLLFDRHLSK
jgi:hypothetical protein